MRRVVITGIGAVTPLGNDIGSTWDNITLQRSGIHEITKFDASALPSRIAGELKEFDPGHYLLPKDVIRLDPFVHYAAAAALMAVEDSGLTGEQTAASSQPSQIQTQTEKSRAPHFSHLNSAGVIIGSSRGGITTLENALERNIIKGKPLSAYLMSSSTINMAASYISMRFGIRGPALGISTACASGTNAIGEAFRMIRTGEVDIALAGGSEAPLCRIAVGGYGASGALSRKNERPEQASRPFERDRDGFVIAEGACVLVLEELGHAAKRNAIIYGELIGYGTSCDAFHQTKPDSDGEALAIRKALDDALVGSEDIEFINAHGTSTPLGDKAEAEAIRKVFGRRTGDIYVSSCKSTLGHMLGAAGAMEAAITALSVKRGIIPPTMNLENPDPECDLNIVTSTMHKDIHIAVSSSFGFGGVNAVLVLKKYQG